MTIRTAENGDIACVAALEGECFSEPWSEGALDEEMAHDFAVYIVAEEEGEVIGYAGARVIGDEGQIANVAVTQRYRRRGVGRALMADLERRCIEKGALVMQLEVRASNEGARAMYEGLGYEVVGVRKRFYRRPIEDGVMMNKRVAVGNSELYHCDIRKTNDLR